MKNYTYFINLAIILFAVSLHAQDNTQRTAINKAKSDLMEILTKPDNQFNFGISADELKQSQPASEIPYKEMDFERLLNYNQQGINEVTSSEQKLIVPLVNNSKVITTVTISNKKEVAELINHQFQNELNQLPNDIKDRNFKGLNIIYVPNLNTIVYVDNDKSYTSYDGRSVRSAIATKELLKVLKEDAVAFKQEYGDKIKDGKLLH